MKKGILSITALAVVLLISFTSLTVNPAANATEKKPAVTVSEEKALGARFLNMLNHNFVYNDAFESVYEMTACSEVALLDKAEDGYIKQSLIAGYLYNMYGVENADFATVTKDFPQRENYVYVIPRGFSVYKHSAPVITENEDGSYTVVTDVEISSHDSDAENAKATTLFVKNENSAFGFNIISSDISAIGYNA